MRTSDTLLSAMANALISSAAGGKLRFYSGTRPAGPGTALSGNTLLAELTLGSPAFPSAVNGVLTSNAITQDASADASGTCTFARLFASDGTTALHDFSVSATGGGGEIQFSTTTFTATLPVNVPTLTIAVPMGT